MSSLGEAARFLGFFGPGGTIFGVSTGAGGSMLGLGGEKVCAMFSRCDEKGCSPLEASDPYGVFESDSLER